jgi:biotin carboxyl carrier protein
MRKFKVTVDGNVYEVTVEEETTSRSDAAAVRAGQKKTEEAQAPPRIVPLAPSVPVTTRVETPTARVSENGKHIPSPMPGVILDIKVKPGDRVEPGTVMFLLEAMKMENEIPAPWPGTVKEILVSKGASVETGQALALIE